MGVGSGGGGQSPSILKFDIFILILQKCYSLNFGLVKSKFTTVTPWQKSFWTLPVKIHCCPPPEKIFPTPMCRDRDGCGRATGKNHALKVAAVQQKAETPSTLASHAPRQQIFGYYYHCYCSALTITYPCNFQ